MQCTNNLREYKCPSKVISSMFFPVLFLVKGLLYPHGVVTVYLLIENVFTHVYAVPSMQKSENNFFFFFSFLLRESRK